MKNCKKMLAIVLCLCAVLSATVFSASAGDPAPRYASISVTSADAVRFKEGDPQTVLQLELGVEVVPSKYADAPDVSFDTVNESAEIVIYDGLYVTVGEPVSDVMKTGKNIVFDEAVIATAKAVSYADGVLTIDVFSKNGEPGAKMISLLPEGFEYSPIKDFYFLLPLGLLTDSSSGYTNSGARVNANVKYLQKLPLKMPWLIKSMLKDYVSGNTGSMARKLIFFPFAPLLIPILLNVLQKRAQKIYDLYDIDLSRLFADGKRALSKRIPYIAAAVF